MEHQKLKLGIQKQESSNFLGDSELFHEIQTANACIDTKELEMEWGYGYDQLKLSKGGYKNLFRKRLSLPNIYSDEFSAKGQEE